MLKLEPRILQKDLLLQRKERPILQKFAQLGQELAAEWRILHQEQLGQKLAAERRILHQEHLGQKLAAAHRILHQKQLGPKR